MSVEPLSRDGAWFVGLTADGSLDREWPYCTPGRTGVEIVLGESAKIVKVIPITTAREVVRAAEERAQRLRDAWDDLHHDLGCADHLVRTEWVYQQVNEALAADDAARGDG